MPAVNLDQERIGVPTLRGCLTSTYSFSVAVSTCFRQKSAASSTKFRQTFDMLSTYSTRKNHRSGIILILDLFHSWSCSIVGIITLPELFYSWNLYILGTIPASKLFLFWNYPVPGIIPILDAFLFAGAFF